MRNLKKFLALVLAMMMALSLMVTVNAASPDFTDADQVDEKFAEAVEVMSSIGIFRGTDENGTVEFQPKGNVTRAQMAAVVYRLATGDADDTRAHLYREYATFDDVSSTAWYAGYVGFCSDAQIIKGYGDNSFRPNQAVTGYEALAMLLRAVGYGKGGEFEGANWKVNVGATATGEKLLKNVNTSNYAGTLNQTALREMLAEITFQAAQIPTVQYQYGTYNKYTNLISGILNPSLGEKFYGLASMIGIIVGNQQTGEKDTLLGVEVSWSAAAERYYLGDNGSYNYGNDDSQAGPPAVPAKSATIKFNTETGLDKFGHKVTIWYDNRTDQGTQTIGTTSVNYASTVVEKFNGVYTVVDKATKTDVVKATPATPKQPDVSDTSTTGELGKVAKDAGFKVGASTKAQWSDAFGVFASDPVTKTAANYGVSAAKPGETFSTGAKDIYLLISNSDDNALDVVISLAVSLDQVDKVNNYATDKTVTMKTDNGAAIYRSVPASTDKNLLVYGENDITVGSRVVLNKIAGTSADANYTGSTLANFKYYGINKPTETKTGTVTAISGSGTVTLSGGETIAQSVVWDATDTAGHCGAANLKIGATLTFVLDAYGKYVRVYKDSDTKLVGAYGYWTLEGIDGFTYYLQGVKKDGTIDTVEVTEATYKSVIADVAAADREIHFMGTAKEGYDGQYVGIVNPAATKSGYQVYEVNGSKVLSQNDWAYTIQDSDDNSTAVNTKWTSDTKGIITQANGVKPSDTASDNIQNYFTSDTKFYVISGWGSTLKVDTYTGLSDLLAGANSLEVEGWFTTTEDDSEHVDSNNNVVDCVYLVNLKRIQPSTFLYTKDAHTVGSTDPMTEDANAVMLQMYVDGAADTAGVLISDIDGTATTSVGSPNGSASLAANTFYSYTLDSNGYYVLTADDMDGSEYGYTSNALTNANTAFGDIADGTATIHAGDAKIVDLTDHGINDYMSLRRAVEENSGIKVDVLLSGALNGDNVGTAILIYVHTFTT